MRCVGLIQHGIKLGIGQSVAADMEKIWRRYGLLAGRVLLFHPEDFPMLA